MKLIRAITIFLIFVFLTVLTQVGGIIYLISLSANSLIDKKIAIKYLRTIYKTSFFIVFYLFSTFIIVPILAKPLGRVQLPLLKSHNLQPLNIMTCILNRNYVTLELKNAIVKVSDEINQSHPGTIINYLDASFPFINKFPLFPHLSHNDGKKLDISFCYIDAQTGKESNKCPSFIGYGICEEPRSYEKNTSDFYEASGYWQYGLMRKIIPQDNKKNFIFDSVRTKEIINLFVSQSEIKKIFIEPHLKTRLGITSDKIRFHGCQAVRHDDHIHIQL